MMAAPASPSRPLLDQLLAGIVSAPAIAVSDITRHSQRVTPGALFIACAGETGHGLDYLEDALRRGAAAVVYEPRSALPLVTGDVPALPVTGLRRELGRLARRFFGDPSSKLAASAVTGTNGKTTVAWLLAGALSELGRPAGYIGTLGAGVDPAALTKTGLTTPDVVELNRALAGFIDDGASAAVLEASSHALSQDRLAGVGIDTAIFTNLGHDHLDYHGTREAYAAAKARLFERRELRTRIINVDDEFGAALAARYGHVLRTTKREADAAGPGMLAATDIHASGAGLDFLVLRDGERARVTSPLLGEFNVDNLLAVLAALVADGVDLQSAAAAVSAVAAPPGRMQRIATNTDLTVVVDFAHTDDALAHALAALRRHCRGKLSVVFGAGGDRDRSKRAPMGAAAAAGADRLYVTSDNPRNESPVAIIDDIVAGIGSHPALIRQVDRRTAIIEAVLDAEPGDVVLVAGRGHEREQIIGTDRVPLHDATVARAALEMRA